MSELLPQSFLNRLYLGRPVATRPAHSDAGIETWLLVRPVVDSACPIISRVGSEDRVEPGDGSAILGYLVVEVKAGGVMSDLQKFPEFTDQTVHLSGMYEFVPDAAILARMTSNRLAGVSALRIPDEVGCPLPNLLNGRTVLSGTDALMEAVRRNNYAAAAGLIDAGVDVNDSGSPLRYAVWHGSSPMVRFLLEKGADPNRDYYLVSAARDGKLEVVNLLLEWGADVDLPGYGDRTALWMAVDRGYIEIVKALISHGADVNKTCMHGFTPLEVAINRGHREITDLLQSKGAKSTRMHIHGWGSWSQPTTP